jgi:hypothetical protein
MAVQWKAGTGLSALAFLLEGQTLLLKPHQSGVNVLKS